MLLTSHENQDLRCVLCDETCLQHHYQQMDLDSVREIRFLLAGYTCSFQRGQILVLQVTKIGMMACPNSHSSGVTGVDLESQGPEHNAAHKDFCLPSCTSLWPCCSLLFYPSRPPGVLLGQFKPFEQSFTLWPDSLFILLAWNATLDKSRKMVFPFPLLYWKRRAISDPLTPTSQPSQPAIGWVLVALMFSPF